MLWAVRSSEHNCKRINISIFLFGLLIDESFSYLLLKKIEYLPATTFFNFFQFFFFVQHAVDTD